MGERFCNELNPFVHAAGQQKHAHALRMRGKHMFQSVPRGQTVNSRPLVFQWLTGIFLIVGFVGFIGFQIIRTISAPTLALLNPIDGITTSEPEITVSGHADPEVTVQINGQRVFSGPDGVFKQQVELQNGANQIIVRAEKNHGHFTTLTRTIMLKLPEHGTSPMSLSPTQIPAQSLN